MKQDAPSFEYLRKFGLSDHECLLYTFLLGTQPHTAVEISQALHIPRSTIYDSITKLIERGLVERILEYKTQRFRAYPLTMLKECIEKEKENVLSLTRAYEKLKDLFPQKIHASTQTQVRYYHGPTGFKQMMTNTLQAQKEIVGYSVFGRVEVVGQKFIKWLNNEFTLHNITDRVITNDTPEVISYLQQPEEIQYRKQYQTTRVLGKDQLYITGDIAIYNSIYAVTWWKQGEVVGVEIENPEFVKTEKSIFEMMWNAAKPLK